nr:unnamed protein product [Callosobruchus chinensis]
MVRQCIGYSRGYSNYSIKEILEETESDKTKIECLKKKYCFSERLLNSSYVMHINISKHLVKINFLKTICPEKLKMRECPAKRSEQKEKERQKYIRQKEQGIRKSIKGMTPKEQQKNEKNGKNTLELNRQSGNLLSQMIRQCIGYSRGYCYYSIKEILEETESDKTKIECLKKKLLFGEVIKLQLRDAYKYFETSRVKQVF